MNYNEKSPDIIVFGITIYFLHSAHSISLNVSWTTQRIRQWNNMISEKKIPVNYLFIYQYFGFHEPDQ